MPRRLHEGFCEVDFHEIPIDSATMKHSTSLSAVFKLDLTNLATEFIILW